MVLPREAGEAVVEPGRLDLVQQRDERYDGGSVFRFVAFGKVQAHRCGQGLQFFPRRLENGAVAPFERGRAGGDDALEKGGTLLQRVEGEHRAH